MTKIKLCGLTRKEDIQYANEAAPDYVGFVFDKGRHFVSDETARECRSILDPCILAAGVFVREDPGHIIHLVREGIIQLVQLHGSESESYIERLKTRISCPIIRVISVKSKEDILKGQETEADYLLLDHGKGGTGKSFDWACIPSIGKPWFLAGGISLDNLDAAISLHPFAVDISSGAETGGKKDREKMKELVRKVRESEGSTL